MLLSVKIPDPEPLKKNVAMFSKYMFIFLENVFMFFKKMNMYFESSANVYISDKYRSKSLAPPLIPKSFFNMRLRMFVKFELVISSTNTMSETFRPNLISMQIRYS